MSNLIAIKNDTRTYMIKCGDGYTCLGFDVADAWSHAVLAWLARELQPSGLPKVVIPEVGTEAHFNVYMRIMAIGDQLHRHTGKRCPALLTPELIGHEGKKAEIVDKYGDHRKFWIGRSTGWLPVHLECNHRAGGGPAVTGSPFQQCTIIGASRSTAEATSSV